MKIFFKLDALDNCIFRYLKLKINLSLLMVYICFQKPCDPSIISGNPYFRPLIHFSRTYDGKHLSYLPVLIHQYGAINFVSSVQRNTFELQDHVVADCGPLKSFLEQYIRAINPCKLLKDSCSVDLNKSINFTNLLIFFSLDIWSSQMNDERDSFWWEATELKDMYLMTPNLIDESLLLSVNSPITSGLLHKFPEIYTTARKYVKSGGSWNQSTPAVPYLTLHHDKNVFEKDNITSSPSSINSTLIGLSKNYARIVCDRGTSQPMPQEGRSLALHQVGYTIRMHSDHLDVFTTACPRIAQDGLFIPYNGEAAQKVRYM